MNDEEWATVHSVTAATDVTVNSGCDLYILGGLASNVTVNDFGEVDVYRGGIVNGGTVNGANSSGGSGGLWVSSGGSVNNVLVNGCLRIESDGIATNIVENGGYVYLSEDWEGGQPDVTFQPNSFSGLVLDGTWTTVHSGTTATDMTVNYDGIFHVGISR